MSACRTSISALAILAIFALLVLIVTGLDYLTCSLYCGRMASFFSNTGAPASDAAVVFFGDHDRKLELGRETIQRLNHAAELYGSGKTANIVCTGGSGLIRLRGVSGAELMKKYLAEAGVPAGNIFVETESYDSLTNWEKSLAIITTHRWKRITLVSSTLHLYRLAGVARGDSLELSYSPYSTNGIGSFRDYLTRRRWIHHEWIAFTAQTVLPQRWYRAAIKVIRR